MKTKPNDYAFPSTDDVTDAGITKREYIATHIAQGLLAAPQCKSFWGDVAREAIEMTDYLINELNKSEK